MHSAILIIPAALLPQANAVGASMGWGPESYQIPLSSDGETVTHWGLRADVSTEFVNWIKGVEPLPDPAAQPIVDALIADFSPDPTIVDDPRPVLWGRAHLDAVLVAHGITAMPPQAAPNQITAILGMDGVAVIEAMGLTQVPADAL